ncbi:MAG: DsrE family protein [Chloroflexi bacterium]|nr:DsrE family protein [Chloroflexota bacterium]
MAKLMFMGVHGSADPTNATLPFIMANGAVEAGHEAVVVLMNEAVDLLREVVRQNIQGVGWPPFPEIFTRMVDNGVPVYV